MGGRSRTDVDHRGSLFVDQVGEIRQALDLGQTQQRHPQQQGQTQSSEHQWLPSVMERYTDDTQTDTQTMMRQNDGAGNYLPRGETELAICMMVVAGGSPSTGTASAVMESIENII